MECLRARSTGKPPIRRSLFACPRTYGAAGYHCSAKRPDGQDEIRLAIKAWTERATSDPSPVDHPTHL